VSCSSSTTSTRTPVSRSDLFKLKALSIDSLV
jgi:hypothetical protein